MQNCYNPQHVLFFILSFIFNRLEVTLAIFQTTFLQLTTVILTKKLKFQQRYENKLLTK